MPKDDENGPIDEHLQEGSHKYSPADVQVISSEEMGQWSLWKVMRYLCHRHHAYFDGNFRYAAMFIDGFACGRSKNGIATTHTELDRFRIWLMKHWAGTLSVPAYSAWWVFVLALYPNDEEAFQNLPKLLDEFEAQEI